MKRGIVRNIIAVILGAMLGGLINMGIIMMSSYVIPPPAGVDLTTPEGLQAAKGLLEPQHFIFPFLAHAVGTLIGALLTVIIAKNRRLMLAMIIGGFFLIGGISATFMIPAPTWFIILDLVLAYIPMAWLAYKIRKQF